MEDFKNNFKEAISTGDTKEIMHLIQSLRDVRDDMSQGDRTRVLGQGLYDVIISPNRTVDLVRQLTEAGADVNQRLFQTNGSVTSSRRTEKQLRNHNRNRTLSYPEWSRDQSQEHQRTNGLSSSLLERRAPESCFGAIDRQSAKCFGERSPYRRKFSTFGFKVSRKG